ncbi:hypothetical protein TcasGA2_TC015527 [Tribolium castaneum]|uniref:Uncharacterized protein n=1 Tax=Tribolium castaneum TaxID=7070 RepID=D2A5E8_TRICA|nr:hypothetical protein TcasGA2_TC015527 [Tribolium castaneum]
MGTEGRKGWKKFRLREIRIHKMELIGIIVYKRRKGKDLSLNRRENITLILARTSPITAKLNHSSKNSPFCGNTRGFRAEFRSETAIRADLREVFAQVAASLE